MADFKFKVDDAESDEHMDSRLSRQHKDPEQSVTEKQLDEIDFRVDDDKEVTTEKQLEAVRSDNREAVTEKLLNDSKSKFGILHRNEEAHIGNFNKLEEQRVLQKKKSEKYEPASVTKKKLRWWEEKTDDGLKLASDKKKVVISKNCQECAIPQIKKIAQEVKDNDIPEYPTEQSPVETKSQAERGLSIVDVSEDNNITTVEFAFDPIAYGNKDSLVFREAQILITSVYPHLAQVIDGGEFEKIADDRIIFTGVGEKYSLTKDNSNGNNLNETPATIDKFSEEGFRQFDDGGTTTATGIIKFDPSIVDEKTTPEEIVEFINEKHRQDNITVSEENINFSGLLKGEVSYMVSPDMESSDESLQLAASSRNFPITVLSDVKKK